MSAKSLAACKFGLDSEIPAMQLYVQAFPGLVGHCYQPGLCVSNLYPNLAATPDFIAYADRCSRSILPSSSHRAWLVEVKSFTHDKSFANDIWELAEERGKGFCCRQQSDGTLGIRRKHKFYFQIIGQLNIVFGPDPS